MADNFIVPPASIEDNEIRIFYEQVCNLLNESTEFVENPPDSFPDTAPEIVSGFNASGGYGSIVLSYFQPDYDGHSYTIFVRAEDGVFSNAVPVGSSTGDMFVDKILDPIIGTTYTYWAVNVNLRGDQGDTYSSPASASVAVDVGYATDILAGKLGYDEFDYENGVFPVRTEDVLPTLPDAYYPLSSLILLTTNGQVYRNVAGTWSSAIPLIDVTGAGDLAGLSTITETEISDNAVTAGKIGADAVTANKILAGSITAIKIDTDAVTSDKILANAIGAGKIATGALVVDDAVMNDGYIKTALIDNAAITSAKIGLLEVKTANIDTLAVTDAKIDTLTAGKITAGTITASVEMTAATVTGGTIRTSSTATTAGGIVMTGDTLTVYDASGNIRVKLGDLS